MCREKVTTFCRLKRMLKEIEGFVWFLACVPFLSNRSKFMKTSVSRAVTHKSKDLIIYTLVEA